MRLQKFQRAAGSRQLASGNEYAAVRRGISSANRLISLRPLYGFARDTPRLTTADWDLSILCRSAFGVERFLSPFPACRSVWTDFRARKLIAVRRVTFAVRVAAFFSAWPDCAARSAGAEFTAQGNRDVTTYELGGVQ